MDMSGLRSSWARRAGNLAQGFQFLGLEAFFLEFLLNRHVDDDAVHADEILFLIENGNGMIDAVDQAAILMNQAVFRMQFRLLAQRFGA